MKLTAHHWAIAIGLSAGIHLAFFASGESAQTISAENSAGSPDAVWGVAASAALSESVEAVEEPSIEPKPVEETLEPKKPMEVAELKAPEATLQALSDIAPSIIPEAELSEEIPVEILEPVREKAVKKPKPKKKKKKAKKKAKKKTASLGGPVGRASGNSGRSSNSSSGSASSANYSSRVLSHLRRHKRYPGGGSRGTVRMVFVLGSNGSVRSVRISGRSGSSSLDNAALAMVRRASPFPSFPSGIGKSSLTFSVPVRFSP